MTTRSSRRARRTATWTLAGIGLALLGIVVVAVILAHGHATASPPRPQRHVPPPSTNTHWNAGAENALASRHMLLLPPQAAQPQPLSAKTAGRSIELPTGSATIDRWIPGGFPASSSGALAQLKALDQHAVAGGDPQTYIRAYRDLALPGGPNPQTTGLFSVLTNFRASGGLPEDGPVAGLSVSYDITQGLVKGTTDHGRYAVVCVLGELTVQYQAQTISAGVGDCQALRWTGSDWRISPGVLAAPATCAWPGSADSVAAGYRELS